MDQEELKRRLHLLEQAEKNRLKNYGIEGYVPNPQQYKAHREMARTILYIGGNRAGKSTFGATDLTFHLTKQYPSWYPEEKRFKGPIKAAISATEYPVVQRVIEPKLFGFLPQGYYKFKRTPQGYLQRMTCQDGSTVDMLTSEMKDEAYESADWDYIWCDEPQSQRKYQAMRRGLIDRQGRMCITFTPLTEPWMKEELVDKADGKRIATVQVNIRDNLADMRGNAILSEEAISEFEDSLPEDVRETRIKGQFFHLRGVVYREFGDAHINPELKYEYPDPVICVLDPHDRQPHHLIWAFIDKQQDIHVIWEKTIRCELPDLAAWIRAVEKKKGWKVRKRIIDPNFGRKPARSGSNDSVIQELRRYGASFYEGNDDKELGHMIVRDYLHYNLRKEVTATNKPKLFFHPDCQTTIRSMRNLQYEEWQGKTAGEKDPKESEKQKDTHGADCIRYLCISRPKYYGLERQISETELTGPPY